MPAERLSMRQIREVLRLCFGSKLPQRSIAKSLGLSQGAVSGYLSRARAAGIAWPLPEGRCHGNPRWAGRGSELTQTSRCCDGVLPLRRRFGSEDPQDRSGDEVALKVERVMDGSMHIEKALGRASRLEPLHFTLSPSYTLVRVLGAIVRP
jgi:hypothetical protein